MKFNKATIASLVCMIFAGGIGAVWAWSSSPQMARECTDDDQVLCVAEDRHGHPVYRDQYGYRWVGESDRVG